MLCQLQDSMKHFYKQWLFFYFFIQTIINKPVIILFLLTIVLFYLIIKLAIFTFQFSPRHLLSILVSGECLSFIHLCFTCYGCNTALEKLQRVIPNYTLFNKLCPNVSDMLLKAHILTGCNRIQPLYSVPFSGPSGGVFGVLERWMMTPVNSKPPKVQISLFKVLSTEVTLFSCPMKIAFKF